MARNDIKPEEPKLIKTLVFWAFLILILYICSFFFVSERRSGRNEEDQLEIQRIYSSAWMISAYSPLTYIEGIFITGPFVITTTDKAPKLHPDDRPIWTPPPTPP